MGIKKCNFVVCICESQYPPEHRCRGGSGNTLHVGTCEFSGESAGTVDPKDATAISAHMLCMPFAGVRTAAAVASTLATRQVWAISGQQEETHTVEARISKAAVIHR